MTKRFEFIATGSIEVADDVDSIEAADLIEMNLSGDSITVNHVQMSGPPDAE